MSDDAEPLDAPGWTAIDRAAARLCPQQTPHQFTSQRAYDLEGTSPLPAITVWEGRNPDHWLYVGYGLSELFEKTSPQPDISGFGFELVLRLPRCADETRPPSWPLTLLQGIGHYVLSGHGTLDSGHVIDLGGPLTGPEGGDSALRGVMCVPDPMLRKIDTVHGSLLFLTLFGLTGEELGAVETWDLSRKVSMVAELEPMAITRPSRRSYPSDPDVAPTWRRYATKILL